MSKFDIILSCVVCILYITGKVWMYYKMDRNDDTKDME